MSKSKVLNANITNAIEQLVAVYKEAGVKSLEFVREQESESEFNHLHDFMKSFGKATIIPVVGFDSIPLVEVNKINQALNNFNAVFTGDTEQEVLTTATTIRFLERLANDTNGIVEKVKDVCLARTFLEDGDVIPDTNLVVCKSFGTFALFAQNNNSTTVLNSFYHSECGYISADYDRMTEKEIEAFRRHINSF